MQRKFNNGSTHPYEPTINSCQRGLNGKLEHHFSLEVVMSVWAVALSKVKASWHPVTQSADGDRCLQPAARPLHVTHNSDVKDDVT